MSDGTPERDARWRAIESLFETLFPLSDEERARYWDTHPTAADLQTEVAELLAAEEASRERFDPPTLVREARSAPTRFLPPPGTSLGTYRLERVVAAGGMGTVYEATQASLHRRVAVKVVHALTSPRARRRFEVEAEILAQLRHPGIATVLDAGIQSVEIDGRRVDVPWFAMELVEGATTLDRFVAERSRAERLALFLAIARAVAHAHERGVVHRDLKPANILVDPGGQPKVIDFGIAHWVRAEDEESGDAERSERVGTWSYMAPEQAAEDAAPVDIRADVHGLGAVLFELLCDRPPRQLEGLDAAQRLAALRSEVAPAPRAVRPDVPVEIDAIVRRALAPDRAQRYPTVHEFAEDVRRFLHHEPVLAAPPGTLGRLRKFVRRNRLACASAALVFLALSTGFGVSLRSYLEAEAARVQAVEAREAERRERERADRQFRRAQGVNQFVAGFLREGHPLVHGRDVRMLDVIDRMAASALRVPEDEQGLRIEIPHLVGMAYLGLGELERAEQFLRVACGDLDDPAEARSADTIPALGSLAELRHRQQRLEEAEQLAREAVARAERVLGDQEETYSLMSRLARVLVARGKRDEATIWFERACAGLAQRVPESSPTYLHLRNDLALFHLEDQQPQRAHDVLERVVALAERHLPEGHQLLTSALTNRAAARIQLRRIDEAEADLRRAIASIEGSLGADHVDTLAARNVLAFLAKQQGRLDEAEAGYRRNLAIARSRLDEEHLLVLTLENNLAVLLQHRGRLDEAIAVYAPLVARTRRALGAQHWRLGIYLGGYGRALLDADRPAEADGVLAEAIDVLRATRGPDDATTRQTIENRIAVLRALGRDAEAQALAGDRAP